MSPSMNAFIVPGATFLRTHTSRKLSQNTRTRKLARPRANCTCSNTPPHRNSSIISSAPPGSESIWEAARRAPSEPGVYRFLNAAADVLYVGKALRLRARLRQYVARDDTAVSGVRPAAALGARISAMVREARRVDFIVTQSEAAALALEASMVAEMRPKYNVLLKDDRRHPYAIITFSEDYPRIFVTRSRKRRNSTDRLYGPFVDEGRLRQVLNCIHSVFPLRQRPRRLFSDRPCINYDLGRCPAPCQKLVSTDDYSRTIAKVDKLLKGRVMEVLDEMREEMQTLSSSMDYEAAASCRDRIAMLEKVFFDDGLSGSPISNGPVQSFADDAETAACIVTLDPFISRDVFGIAQSEKIGKVVLFQVRGGKVISRLVFSVAPHESNSSSEDLLSTVLSSHYADAHHPMEIPEEIVLSTTASDTTILKAALSEKRGKSVSIRLPGPRTAPIVRMVQRNAELELSLESQRSSDIIRDVASISALISPYFQDLVAREATEFPRDEDQLQKGTTVLSPTQPTTAVPYGAMSLSRMEGYDISHTSGSNAVGSMSVFIDGVPAPSEYRRYNLSEQSSSRGRPDDFESMRETLRRRFKHFSREGASYSPDSLSLPSLLLIDGGKGQLSAAMNVLQDLGLDSAVAVISIAKQDEAIFVPSLPDPINFDMETCTYIMNGGIRLLCHLRDEAHRTAVSAHKKRRGRQELRSGLDSVPGLGSIKRSALLEHFKGSSEAVAKATRAELQKAPGIGPAIAMRVFNHFHRT